MLNLEKYNHFVSAAYDNSGGTFHEMHKTKVFLVEISKAWLKANGYKYDHFAWTGYWKTPGTIDQMANEKMVRLYLATPTSHHRYQESEVWRKD